MAFLSYAWQLITRNPRRTFTYLFGLVLAVGLFAGILFFVDASSQRMTQSSVQAVSVDLQVVSTLAIPNLDPVIAQLRATPNVVAAQPLISASFGGATSFGSAQDHTGDKTAAAGKVFVIPPEYLSTMKTLRLAAGTFDTQGALVSQQLYSALGLALGDTIAVDFPQMA